MNDDLETWWAAGCVPDGDDFNVALSVDSVEHVVTDALHQYASDSWPAPAEHLSNPRAVGNEVTRFLKILADRAGSFIAISEPPFHCAT
jgi:hypothetical protein